MRRCPKSCASGSACLQPTESPDSDYAAFTGRQHRKAGSQSRLRPRLRGVTRGVGRLFRRSPNGGEISAIVSADSGLAMYDPGPGGHHAPPRSAPSGLPVRGSHDLRRLPMERRKARLARLPPSRHSRWKRDAVYFTARPGVACQTLGWPHMSRFHQSHLVLRL